MKAEKAAEKENSSVGSALAILAFQWRRRAATILAIAIAALVAYHVMFGANGLTIYQKKKNEDRALKQQIMELQQQNDQLQQRIQSLKSDPDTIEHEARTILHYARPGEVIYKLNGSSR